MSNPAAGRPKAYLFGPFRLSVAERLLRRDGALVPLTPKAIDTLFALVEEAGQLVTKDRLMEVVWPDVIVVGSALTRNISVLRKTLEDGLAEGAYIETIPKRGYRFVAPVETVWDEGEPEAAQPMAAPDIVPGKGRRRSWAAGSAGLGVAVLTVAAAVGFRQPPKPEAKAPEVRIGEHLLYKFAPAEALRAKERFERFIAENPRSASAYAGLSMALVQLAGFGVVNPRDAFQRAKEAAVQAVAFDADSPSARCAMGASLMFHDWDFPGAAAELQLALKMDPHSPQIRFTYARLLTTLGKFSQARKQLEEALRLDPVSPALGAQYCQVFYFQRDFERAASECRKVLDREPGYVTAHYFLGLSLGFLDRFEEADENLFASRIAQGVLETDRAWLRLRQGDRESAAARLEETRRGVAAGRYGPLAKLLLASSLGLRDEAFEAIEDGIKSRAPELTMLAVEPRLDSLRADPRYPASLKRIGLAR